jgi:hypothetical protein
VPWRHYAPRRWARVKLCDCRRQGEAGRPHHGSILRRIVVAEVLDAWLAPDYRYFKLRGADGDTFLIRHDERSNTWALTMFRAECVDR